jgi:hypothetical protein
MLVILKSNISNFTLECYNSLRELLKIYYYNFINNSDFYDLQISEKIKKYYLKFYVIYTLHASDLYSGDARLEFRSEHRLPLLSILMSFFSVSRQIPGEYLKVDHGLFL